MKVVPTIPRPVRIGERDPNEPAPVSGQFLVKLRRPDGKICYMQVPDEHFDRIFALTQGEFGDKSIEKIFPREAKSESSDTQTGQTPTSRRA